MEFVTTAAQAAAETTATTVLPYYEEIAEPAEANPIMLFFVVVVLLCVGFLAVKGGILRMGCSFCTRGGEITCKWKSGPNEESHPAKFCPMCRRRLK